MSDHLTPERLAGIRWRADAATEGPWVVDPYVSAFESGYCVEPDDGAGGVAPIDCEHEADAEFIAHARTDVPDLLAEVDHLRSVLNNVREYAEYRFPYSGICRDVLDLLNAEETS